MSLPIGLPRYTVRLRLTLLFGAVFLLCAAILLGMTYLLVRGSGDGYTYSVKVSGGGAAISGPHGPLGLAVFQVTRPAPLARQRSGTFRRTKRRRRSGPVGRFGVLRVGPPGAGGNAAGNAALARGEASTAGGNIAAVISAQGAAGALPQLPGPVALVRREAKAQANQLQVLASQQHSDELHHLLTDLGIALAVMCFLSMGLGWLVARRVLRPLQTITRTARSISATNLHRRLALSGPDDELRELGDTFDELLERLERSFEAQRQFVANASHELRTPLTLERAVIEVALADPGADGASLREACRRVLEIGEEQERTIEALLTLARSERGLERRDPVDLAVPAHKALRGAAPAISERGLRTESGIDSAPALGDQDLVERMICNLLDNAIRHNVPGGTLAVRTGLSSGHAFVSVASDGPPIGDEEVLGIFEPFRRLGATRAANGQGHGLGLSIVKAIAVAHRAELSARPRDGGGLEVTVSFPAPPGATHAAATDLRAPAANGGGAGGTGPGAASASGGAGRAAPSRDGVPAP
ncbi:MAG: HAMP domain-containing protein [Acidobacteriota bacterium]|nr:HAMP domain-containing protein [Acidobacteriota bacterium]